MVQRTTTGPAADELRTARTLMVRLAALPDPAVRRAALRGRFPALAARADRLAAAPSRVADVALDELDVLVALLDASAARRVLAADRRVGAQAIQPWAECGAELADAFTVTGTTLDAPGVLAVLDAATTAGARRRAARLAEAAVTASVRRLAADPGLRPGPALATLWSRVLHGTHRAEVSAKRVSYAWVHALALIDPGFLVHLGPVDAPLLAALADPAAAPRWTHEPLGNVPALVAHLTRLLAHLPLDPALRTGLQAGTADPIPTSQGTEVDGPAVALAARCTVWYRLGGPDALRVGLVGRAPVRREGDVLARVAGALGGRSVGVLVDHLVRHQVGVATPAGLAALEAAQVPPVTLARLVTEDAAIAFLMAGQPAAVRRALVALVGPYDLLDLLNRLPRELAAVLAADVVAVRAVLTWPAWTAPGPTGSPIADAVVGHLAAAAGTDELAWAQLFALLDDWPAGLDALTRTAAAVVA